MNEAPGRLWSPWWPMTTLLAVAVVVLLLSATVWRGLTVAAETFVLVHNGLEAINIVLSGMIFAVAWNMRQRGRADIVIATAFLAATVFAIVHVEHIGPHDAMLRPHAVDNAIASWYAARLAAAIGLFVAVLNPWHLAAPPARNGRIFLRFAVVAIAVIAVILHQPNWLPEALFWDQGLTVAKIASEVALATLFALAGLATLWKRIRTRAQLSLFAACVLSAIGELYFVLYGELYEVSTLIGHAVVALAYYLTYRALVSDRLVASNRMIADLNHRVGDLQLRWREALEAGQHGVIEQDHARGLVYPSPQFLRLLGFEAGELPSPCPLAELEQRIHPDDRARELHQVQEMVDSPGSGHSQQEYRMQARDGNYRWLSVRRAVVERDAAGKPLRTIGTVTDITARHRLEESLRQALGQVRELANRERHSIEEERKRIARALHDQFGQNLAVFGMEIGELRRYCRGTPHIDEILNRMETLLGDARGAMREVISDLRPPALDAGLPAAIAHLGDVWSRSTGISTELAVVGHSERIAAAVQTTLFRVLQEALNNIAQHAGANSVLITLTVNDREASLSVADDGLGMEPGARDKVGHFGLFGIEERMEAVGGTVSVESAPGRGTELSVTVPLPQITPFGINSGAAVQERQ